jgi:hypothetical protein
VRLPPAPSPPAPAPLRSAAHGLEENVLQLLSSGRVAAVLGVDISRAELTAQVQKHS